MKTNFTEQQQQLKTKENLIMSLNQDKNLISQQLATLKQANQQLELKNYSQDLFFSTKFKKDDLKLLENGRIAYAKKNVWQVSIFDITNASALCFMMVYALKMSFLMYRGQVSQLGHGYSLYLYKLLCDVQGWVYLFSS
ncbi:unnamed protein product [Paramecium sonneborni]|uniref:Uncharacterized protein n=1 Tax=Paramecium sonneborni TaxID=65129 RepID=A0A8S1QCR5_9CILI|nr:unnamed protein product [Paramecium sonneborni]